MSDMIRQPCMEGTKGMLIKLIVEERELILPSVLNRRFLCGGLLRKPSVSTPLWHMPPIIMHCKYAYWQFRINLLVCMLLTVQQF